MQKTCESPAHAHAGNTKWTSWVKKKGVCDIGSEQYWWGQGMN